MTDKKILFENYNSIAKLNNTLSTRKNNEVMKDKHSSSDEGHKEWYGTETYEEATSLLSFGWGDILDDITAAIEENKKLYYNLVDVKRMKTYNNVVGFTPNVPNAIQNLPKSMINIQHDIKKIKTVSIFYLNDGNCMVSAEDFVRSGGLLLAAIQLLEKNNVRVELNLCFQTTIGQTEICIGSVKLKDFRQPLSLKKICFPMAHPSMLRRIGFKFLETIPGLTDDSVVNGYGHAPTSTEEKEVADFIDKTFPKSNTILLSRRMIADDFDYDMEKLLNSFKLK